MKKTIPALCIAFLVFNTGAQAQRKNIQLSEVPKEVITVLNRYLTILSDSKSVDECADRLAGICAGHLISQTGSKISDDVKSFSLKKDFENVKFYNVPAVITRVQLQKNGYDGYGPTLVQGDIYKIWIAKKDGVAGMPAPVPVIVPNKGSSGPKIISSIGSL